MKKNKKVLILFDGPHIAFSPTTIQLYDELSKNAEVTIIAQDPNNYNGQKLNDRKVLYHPYYSVKTRYFYIIFFQILLLFNKEAKKFKANSLNYKDYFFKFIFIKKHLRKVKYDRIVCNDITNLFFCSELNIKIDFLSLELCKDENLLKIIDKSIIQSVLIQSKERFEYLFKNEAYRLFFVHNSPIYYEQKVKPDRQYLIYSGGAYNVLGFYHCLEFLNKYPNEKMILQGAFLKADKERVDKEFSHLIKEERLIINSQYLENSEVVEFISQYQIGLCFYNFDDPFIQKNYFNYISAPSGKMFKYLAAGVPVVCSNILGFSFVNDFKCGITIDNLNDTTIYQAISEIRNNYDFYVANAIKAAQHFSFDKAVAPYINYISSDN